MHGRLLSFRAALTKPIVASSQSAVAPSLRVSASLNAQLRRQLQDTPTRPLSFARLYATAPAPGEKVEEPISDAERNRKEHTAIANATCTECTSFGEAFGKLHGGCISRLLKAADVETGETELHVAAALNSPTLIKAFLFNAATTPAFDANGVIHLSVNHEGLNALHLAARSGNKEAVLTLMQAGANVAAVDTKGRNAFHWAATSSSRETMETLLLALDVGDRDCINVPDEAGDCPVHLAARFGWDKTLLALLGASADPKKGNPRTGYTALHYAISPTADDHGHGPDGQRWDVIMAILTSIPGTLTLQNCHGNLPLHSAAQSAIPWALRILLMGEGKDVIEAKNESYMTPLCSLMAAVPKLYQETLDPKLTDKHLLLSTLILLGKGAFVDAKMDNGWNPFLLSLCAFDIDNPYYESSMKSVEGEPPKNDVRRHNNVAVSLKLSEMILEKKPNLFARTVEGHTTLWFAAKVGFEDIVDQLLEAGVDPLLTNEDGATPLHVATNGNNLNVMRSLIEAGGEKLVNVTNSAGESALHAAVAIENWAAAHLLARSGANPDIVSHEGNTVLHYVCQTSDDDIELFMNGYCSRVGVNISAVNKNGHTPLDIALGCRKDNKAILLQKLGGHYGSRQGLL
eukprot:TRINITY_DN2842_c0_g1_i1.p1 TRINITY_DN2842_c0_g1~~TRINITY_DN2842_c0_g1_i1.p1  ORF type:complete len:640 (+),score=151.86 TRINITY_DN2842_c0_g1_i1:30-1922(+)